MLAKALAAALAPICLAGCLTNRAQVPANSDLGRRGPYGIGAVHQSYGQSLRPEWALAPSLMPRGSSLTPEYWDDSSNIPAVRKHRHDNPPRILSGGDARTLKYRYAGYENPVRAYANEVYLYKDGSFTLTPASSFPGKGEKISVVSADRRLLGAPATVGKVFLGFVNPYMFLEIPIGIAGLASAAAGNSDNHIVGLAQHCWTNRYESVNESFGTSLGEQTSRTRVDVQREEPEKIATVEPGDTIALLQNRRTKAIYGPVPSDVIGLWAELQKPERVRKVTANPERGRSGFSFKAIWRAFGAPIRGIAGAFKSDRVDPSPGRIAIAEAAMLCATRPLLEWSNSELLDSKDRAVEWDNTSDELIGWDSNGELLATVSNADALQTKDRANTLEASETPYLPLKVKKKAQNARLRLGQETVISMKVIKPEDLAISNIILVEALPEGLVYVEGSSSPPPTRIVRSPDGATTVVWDLADDGKRGNRVIRYAARLRYPHEPAAL